MPASSRTAVEAAFRCGRRQGRLAQVADGAGQVADGAGQLDAGAKKLSGGAAQVDGGAARVAQGLHLVGGDAPELLDGLAQVADGLDRVDAGLTQLFDGVGSPRTRRSRSTQVSPSCAPASTEGQDGALIDGVDQIRAGLAAATETDGSIDQLKGGIKQVHAGLAGALATGGGIDRLDGGVALASGSADCGTFCKTVLGQVAGGLSTLRQDTTDAKAGLEKVSGGLGLLKGKAQRRGLWSRQGRVRPEQHDARRHLRPEGPGPARGCRPRRRQPRTKLVDGVVGKVQGGIGTPTDHAEGQDPPRRRQQPPGRRGRRSASVASTCSTPSTRPRSVQDQVHGGTSQVATGAKDLGAGAANRERVH